MEQRVEDREVGLSVPRWVLIAQVRNQSASWASIACDLGHGQRLPAGPVAR